MSHSRGVKRISRWPHRSGLFHSFVRFYRFFFFFFCIVISLFRVRKSPVAVTLSVLQFCVHILFFDNCTYLKVKREKYPSEIYIFCSLILFNCSLKIKVFGNTRERFICCNLSQTRTCPASEHTEVIVMITFGR